MKKSLVYIMHRVDKRGGQERSSLEYLLRLARRGWQIHVISYTFDDWPEDLVKIWTPVPGDRIRPQILRDLWFSIYTIPLALMHRSKNVILTTGTCSWIADVRVVQFCHSAFHKLIADGKVVPPNPRTKLHEIYQKAFTIWESFLEVVLFRLTSQFVAISDSVKRSLAQSPLNVGGEKVAIIHHAPDAVENKTQLADDKVRILFVGAMERKGIDKVLRSLSMCKSANWFLDVVGDGDIARWGQVAKDLGIDQKVTFHGIKNSHEFFPKSDVFLFPSCYEPYGLVVSEAASYGLVPIVSNECGAMELWTDKPEWLDLSAWDSDEKWQLAIEKLLDDKVLRQEIAKGAHEQFMAWNWDKAAEKYDAVFSEIYQNK